MWPRRFFHKSQQEKAPLFRVMPLPQMADTSRVNVADYRALSRLWLEREIPSRQFSTRLGSSRWHLFSHAHDEAFMAKVDIVVHAGTESRIWRGWPAPAACPKCLLRRCGLGSLAGSLAFPQPGHCR